MLFGWFETIKDCKESIFSIASQTRLGLKDKRVSLKDVFVASVEKAFCS